MKSRQRKSACTAATVASANAKTSYEYYTTAAVKRQVPDFEVLDGGCQVPIAGHAEMLDDDRFILDGLVAEVDGSVILREQQEGTAATARETGFALARHLLDKGGKDILDRLYAENR